MALCGGATVRACLSTPSAMSLFFLVDSAMAAFDLDKSMTYIGVQKSVNPVQALPALQTHSRVHMVIHSFCGWLPIGLAPLPPSP